VRTLTLVEHRLPQDPHELRRLEAEDLAPRTLLYRDALNSDMLDGAYLRQAPTARSLLYRRLPTPVAQVLEAYAVRSRYDAIISWDDRLGLPFAGLLKVTGARYPHVAILLWISKPKKARLLRRVHSHIDRLIIPSPAQRDFAIEELRIPREKIVAIPWTVDTRFWRPQPDTPDMICAVGSEMRDYPTLIAALADLPIPCHVAAGAMRDLISPWIRAIDGTGPLPGHVTVGKRSFAELRRLYARSRFVVVPLLPTDNDNGITSILEAMGMGRAVISTRTRGQVGVVVEGETGLMVPPEDPRALREAIQYLWEHPDVAERMGRAGRQRVERHYTFDDFVARVRRVVLDVVRLPDPRLASSGLAGRET
jgi:glycosyltransferase involved in cell wall biosynthesis